jgi:hypothetical protein
VFIPRDTPAGHWTNLVHIVLALSGVEAVANMTGIMVHPLNRTVRWTIWPVAIEVVVLNLVFALAMNALPEARLEGRTADMLRALSSEYVGSLFASASSIVFALLLLSASSTAITGMLGILFAMSRDGELPRGLSRLNRFGVPLNALFLATVVPVGVLLLERDLEGLAALYAIGVVGAIAINCLSTSRTAKATVSRLERRGLLAVGLLMAAAWVTIAIEKPRALAFACVVLGVGLAARLAFRRYREVARPVQKIPFPADAPRILIATRGDRWPVDAGYERAAETGAACIVALIREASFLLGAVDTKAFDPAADPEAARVFDYARREAQDRDIPLRTVYELSTAPMSVIADHAVTLGVSEVHVGGSRRSKLEKLARGSPLEELRSLLPEDVRMIVHRPPQGEAGRSRQDE